MSKLSVLLALTLPLVCWAAETGPVKPKEVLAPKTIFPEAAKGSVRQRSAAVRTGIRCPEGWHDPGVGIGSCYQLNTSPKTWLDAQETCGRHPGGSLATIKSLAEQTALVEFLEGLVFESAWIGASDLFNGRRWTWVDGSSFINYGNWTTTSYTKHCAVFLGSSLLGSWQQQDCNATKPFVCQISGSSRISLYGGNGASAGHVVVTSLVSGQSGFVCDDAWDDLDAAVVCRQLGFRLGKATSRSFFGLLPASPSFAMDDVFCQGDEVDILQCPFLGWGQHNCGTGEGAGVICSNSNEVTSRISLEAGDGYSYGHVVVTDLTTGQSGYVCDDSWDHQDATVVCRQLGFTTGEATVNSHFGVLPNSNFIMDDVNCLGWEPELANCSHSDRHNCQQYEGAGVICSNANTIISTPPPTSTYRPSGESSTATRSTSPPQTSVTVRPTVVTTTPVSWTVQLVQGNASMGHVLVTNEAGDSGYICDDIWDYRDADVVCMQLGFSSGQPTVNSYFGFLATANFVLDDVQCNGTESNILQCGNAGGWRAHNCGVSEAAGVKCSG